MKLKIIISLLTILFTHTCKNNSASQNNSSASFPVCLKSRIEAFEKQNNCSSAHVDEMSFQAKTVYVFNPGTCGADMTTDVIDNNCKTLGSLGGITGNSKIEGAEFSQAKFVKTLWSRN